MCSYDKPTDYFSVYFIIIFYLLYYFIIIFYYFSVYGSLCTRTNGVTPVEFCCEASVLQILLCLIKIDLGIVFVVVFPLVSPHNVSLL